MNFNGMPFFYLNNTGTTEVVGLILLSSRNLSKTAFHFGIFIVKIAVDPSLPAISPAVKSASSFLFREESVTLP